jgi:outer membrane protein
MTSTNPVVEATRQISLQEAIELALEHNLDVQIERINPTIARFNLNGAYGVYEPQLNLSGVHSSRTQPGRTDPETGLTPPAQKAESDSFSGSLIPGVSGIFPTGLSYRMDANVVHSTFNPPGREEYSGNWNLRLEQPLLRDFWIDQGRAQILIQKKALKMSELALTGRIMETISAVEQAYYNLIFARENVRVQATALDLGKRSLSDTQRRVQVGTLAQLEEEQAKARVATSQADLLSAERNLAVQQNILKSLITDDYAAWHAMNLVPTENLVPVPIALDVQESWARGLKLRPDLQQVRIDLERRDITLRYQKNQLYPALDLVGSYGHNGLNTSYRGVLDDLLRDDNPNFSYGAVLSVPLGNFNARNRYKASKAEKQQALLQLKQLEQLIMVQIDDAIQQARNSFQRVDATRQARLFAEAALEAEEKKLESGKSTPFLVLQFQRDLTAARFEEIRALAEYNNAIAQLAFREGTSLQRHGLDVKVK